MLHNKMLHRPMAYALAFLFGALISVGHADQSVLDRYVGNWTVHLKTLQPERSEITYTERYKWVLDHKFLFGETGGKPDGTTDRIYGTYDSHARGYPFWIFSSTGTYLYLAPATWHQRKQMLEWKNPKGLDVIYRTQCVFPSKNVRSCKMVLKNWAGQVLLEQEWIATRK